ncbi:MAG: nucleoside deaminase [Pirellulaceae bacterium]|nr:nucleoside deaminase [Pirellulaceae bacterium]
MRAAIELAIEGVRENRGGPFGAVVVKEGQIVGRGCNRVTSTNDPTAHAEVVAIRDACQNLGTFLLAGCEIYASCEPCPMCLASIYWARLEKLYFGCTGPDAAAIGFDDDFIRQQLALAPAARSIPAQRLLADEALTAFRAWTAKVDRIAY